MGGGGPTGSTLAQTQGSAGTTGFYGQGSVNDPAMTRTTLRDQKNLKK